MYKTDIDQESGDIVAYSAAIDAYLATCQEQAYQNTLQSAWNGLQAVPSYLERLPEVVFQHGSWKETVFCQSGSIRLIECTDCGIVSMYRLETPDSRVSSTAYYDLTSAVVAYSNATTVSSKIV